MIQELAKALLAAGSIGIYIGFKVDPYDRNGGDSLQIREDLQADNCQHVFTKNAPYPEEGQVFGPRFQGSVQAALQYIDIQLSRQGKPSLAHFYAEMYPDEKLVTESGPFVAEVADATGKYP